MTYSRRALPFLLAAAALPAVALAAACSGSDSSGGELFDAGSDVTTGDDASSAVDTGAEDSGSSSDTGSSDAKHETSTPFDAGIPVILDGGPDYEGGVPCVVGGTLEQEVNDTEGQANDLMGSLCGSITPAPQDVDFYKYTLAQSATTMTLYFTGDIKMTVKVPGHADTVITSASSPAIPFDPGKLYSVKVETNNGQKQNYMLTLVVH